VRESAYAREMYGRQLVRRAARNSGVCRKSGVSSDRAA